MWEHMIAGGEGIKGALTIAADAATEGAWLLAPADRLSCTLRATADASPPHTSCLSAPPRCRLFVSAVSSPSLPLSRLRLPASAAASAAMVLWVEKYRPQSLADLTLHSGLTATLQQLTSDEDFPHLLF